MNIRITQLLRTNAALALLCMISIGVLFILARSSGRNHEDQSAVQPKIIQMKDASLLNLSDSAATADTFSGTISDAGTSAPAAQQPLPDFEDMPAPSTFTHFVFSSQISVPVHFICSDTYRVTLIFNADTDYRSKPSSAMYNTAMPCNKNEATTSLDLSTVHLQDGNSYYVISGDQGNSGTWHNPR